MEDHHIEAATRKQIPKNIKFFTNTEGDYLMLVLPLIILIELLGRKYKPCKKETKTYFSDLFVWVKVL
jgi:hypothetical protein